MMKPAPGATLGTAVVAEILRAIRVLHRLAPAPYDAFAGFREAYAERYGDREMPLVEVLDEEIGIGFGSDPDAEGSPLLEGVRFRAAPAASEERRSDPRDRVLLRLLADALRSGATEIALDDVDLDGLAAAEPSPPPDTLLRSWRRSRRDRARTPTAATSGC